LKVAVLMKAVPAIDEVCKLVPHLMSEIVVRLVELGLRLMLRPTVDSVFDKGSPQAELEQTHI
jgi:hypothetical protein